jgi:hypothetical protein
MMAASVMASSEIDIRLYLPRNGPLFSRNICDEAGNLDGSSGCRRRFDHGRTLDQLDDGREDA